MAAAIGARRLLLTAAVLFLLASLYGLMGFFQGVMLFTGERALKNSNIWSSVFLIAVALATVCFAASRPEQPKRTALSIIGICFLLSAASAWRVATDFMAVDACLDRTAGIHR